jgi:monoterpene epsilon-lactone hydrolase
MFASQHVRRSQRTSGRIFIWPLVTAGMNADIPMNHFPKETRLARYVWVVSLLFLTPALGMAKAPLVEPDGTVHVPAFDLRESAYLSEETRAALKRDRDLQEEFSAKACGAFTETSRAEMPAIRKCQAEALYKTHIYKELRKRYAVDLKGEQLGGVYTEVFTPVSGIAAENVKRVLINVHGGGFVSGSRIASHLESIPIASMGKIKVISIDYRMAPEYRFPAASEDVAAVYREILKEYRPENIGLYGCSAGGMLTAQSISWFQKNELPLPGAVGMFCGGAPVALDANKDKSLQSDGAHFAEALAGKRSAKDPNSTWYFKNANRFDALVSPGSLDAVMAQFPPALLISGTRDGALSSVLVTHAQLVRLGVPAELHVWEGMGHAFQFNPEIPESREAYQVIVDFFFKHLGKK